MFSRSTYLVLACAALVVPGCQNEKRGMNRPDYGATVSDTPSTHDIPTIEPSPSEAVTNAPPQQRVDPLLSVENRDAIQSPPNTQWLPGPVPARLIAGSATVVRSAPNGATLTTVHVTAGTNDAVSEIAKDPSGESVLVIYADPNDASKNVAGWVSTDAVDGAGARRVSRQ